MTVEQKLNVDHAEVSKFEELAARWWDPDSEFKPLHQINPLRLNYIEERAGGLAERQVLDVGCGGGILSESMAARGARITGIDMGEAPLQVARLHLLETGLDVNYERIPVERLAAERPRSFDLITCMEMLEHVPDPASTVHACAELLKPGGRAFFSTINRNPKSYLFAIIGAEYVLGLLPKGTHDFARFIRPSELDAWLRATGLELEHIIGLVYNPLTRVYKLAPDVDVNYMLCCRKPGDD
jgi:2-polyprenyl-6-hydroxyphenyl methylase/3-demethylubiquinone-9 3-methyltransferase